MTHNTRHIARLAALPLLLLAACQGDDLPQPAPTAQGTSTLTLTVDAERAGTRSTPEAGNSTECQALSAQHVKNVKLYIFQGSGANATYVGMDAAAKWDSLTTTGGGNEVGEGYDTTSKSYTIQTELQPGTTYILLGVAYEKNDIYDIILPSSTPGESGTGTLLGEIDKQGVLLNLSQLSSVLNSEQYGKGDIQENEYFTGITIATTDADGRLPDGTDGTTVTMRRRVAGLGAHLRLLNFPEQPGAVAIMLWKDQYKDVPSIRKEWQLPNFTDHGSTPLEVKEDNTGANDPQCLLYMPVTDAQDGNGYTANGSAYVLPMEAPAYDSETNYTLAVVVYNSAGQAICTKRAALAEDGELIFDPSLGTGIIDEESFYRYPIVANRFYRFGKVNEEMEVKFDPNNPFEIIVEEGWEGMPELDFQ